MTAYPPKDHEDIVNGPLVPVGVEVTGPNTWAVSIQGDVSRDGLATYTLMSGPGIPGVVAPRQEN